MSRILPAALILAGAAGAAHAQGLEESVLSATISQSLEANTNYDLDPESPGTSYFADTGLALDLVRESPTQSLSFGLNTGLRALWRADEDFEFTVADPTAARAGYVNEWASGAASLDLRYRQRRTDFLDDITLDDLIPGEPIPGEPIPDDLTNLEEEATERRYDAALSLAFATDSPSSYALDLQATRFDYSDTAEDLAERQDLRGGATWSLQLTPVLAGRLRAGYTRIETEDETDDSLRTAEADAGFAYDIAPEFSASFGVGYAARERRQTLEVDGEPERLTTEDTSGPLVRAGINYAVADDFALQGDVRVSAAAEDTRVSGDLRANYTLPVGSLTARLSQDFTAASDGEEVRITRAGIGFSRELNVYSSVSFDVTYALQENQDVDTPDITRTDFTATYSRALSEVVFANIGYRFRYRDEVESAQSNAVFFSVGRSFVTRF